jgi:hypothetical protein
MAHLQVANEREYWDMIARATFFPKWCVSVAGSSRQ